MGRRSFSREFKVEAVRLIRDRGVSVAQASRDLDVHGNTLRKWVTESLSPHPEQETTIWRATVFKSKRICAAVQVDIND